VSASVGDGAAREEREEGRGDEGRGGLERWEGAAFESRASSRVDRARGLGDRAPVSSDIFISAGSSGSFDFQSSNRVATSMTKYTAGASGANPRWRTLMRSAKRSQRVCFSVRPVRYGASSSTIASRSRRGLCASTSETYANGRFVVVKTSRTMLLFPVTGGPWTKIGMAWSCGAPRRPKSWTISPFLSGHRRTSF
jgi:hypothetical protein